MPRYDFRTPRLFVEAPLAPGAYVALDREQANYLANVLRLRAGAASSSSTAATASGRRRLRLRPSTRFALVVGEPTRPQPRPWDLHYCVRSAQACAARLHGAEGGRDGRHAPAAGAHPRIRRPSGSISKRMRANAIEAAEQCGILTVAEIGEPATLSRRHCGARPGAPARLLRRGRRDQGPDRGARAGALARPGAGRGPGRPGGRLRRRGTRCADRSARASCGSRSARASCAPIRRRLRPLRSPERCWATGADPWHARNFAGPNLSRW